MTRIRLTAADQTAQRRIALLRAIAYIVTHPEEDSLGLPMTWDEELTTLNGARWTRLAVTVDESTLQQVTRSLEARHGVPSVHVEGAPPASAMLSLLRALMLYVVQEDDLQVTQDPRRDSGGGIPASVTDIEAFRRSVTFSARHNRLADFELQLPR